MNTIKCKCQTLARIISRNDRKTSYHHPNCEHYGTIPVIKITKDDVSFYDHKIENALLSLLDLEENEMATVCFGNVNEKEYWNLKEFEG